jgi:hypothetical protein
VPYTGEWDDPEPARAVELLAGEQISEAPANAGPMTWAGAMLS